MLRTHTCGELTKKHLKAETTLAGWVQSRRDHGGIIFIDLRDRYGLTQVVFDPTHNKEVHAGAEHIGREWVLQVVGHVRERKEGQQNPKLPTGEIEVIADHLEILNVAETPLLEVDDRIDATEEMRMKYRYLDLRRPVMQQRLKLRHMAAQAARNYLSSQNFLEIETPLLGRYTPGGARNYLVPSRTQAGKMYALPESPQVYKQLLMVAGCDRYFQIARCLRDEDLRIDRQPEFTQIDIEMSFVKESDVMTTVEGLMSHLFQTVLDKTVQMPFKRITFHEAMSRYGSDKPDVRFQLELTDTTEACSHSDFNVFKSVIAKGGVVYCLNVPGCAKFTRTEIEELEALAITHHLKGLAWAKMGKAGSMESSIAKYFSNEVQQKIIAKTSAKEGDLLLFAAENFIRATTALGQVRLFLGKKLKLYNEEEFGFIWVTDFPAFEWNEEEQKWQATHHIFTAPKQEDLQYLETEPGKVRSDAYDLAMNGVEIAGGSIRIHRKEVQTRCLKVIGLSYEEAEKKFDFLLNAFKYGAPPHGGIAVGFDRFCAMLAGISDIREVIAFPKNKAAQGLLEGSPGDVSERQLKELHIKFDIAKKP
ncbi:aspartate--tRNA ligase [Candidatus Woesearchaeota archaeon]|nr:aspartate--tRNA ligase [Candidatus Woesearchaeota archaeon]